MTVCGLDSPHLEGNDALIEEYKGTVDLLIVDVSRRVFAALGGFVGVMHRIGYSRNAKEALYGLIFLMIARKRDQMEKRKSHQDIAKLQTLADSCPFLRLQLPIYTSSTTRTSFTVPTIFSTALSHGGRVSGWSVYKGAPPLTISSLIRNQLCDLALLARW